MARTREQLVRDAAARGKYAPLHRHLVSIPASPEWRVTFGELEVLLGFRLPDSARLYRPWWSNQNKGAGHSHALSWHAAGWKTREVDLEAETLSELLALNQFRVATRSVQKCMVSVTTASAEPITRRGVAGEAP